MNPTMDEQTLLADGWRPVETTAFSSAIGPFYVRKGTGDLILGFPTTMKAGNGRGDTIHGGALMTLADMVLGYGAIEAMGHRHNTTVQLQYQFTAAVRAGDFITCRPEVVRKTSKLVFMRGLFQAGDKNVGSADAIFRFFDPPEGVKAG